MLYNYLKNFGYDDKAIQKIYAINYQRKDETLLENATHILPYLLDFGFSKKQIIRIITKAPNILANRLEPIKLRIENLLKTYSQKAILKMICDQPSLLALSASSIERKKTELERLGFTHEQMLKITKEYSCIYAINTESILSKMYEMMRLGYPSNKIIKMFLKAPTIMGCSLEKIKETLIRIEELGFSSLEAIYITSITPQIFTFNFENSIIPRFKNLLSLGYTHDEARQIVKDFPSILMLTIENINEKVSFYREINLEKIPIWDAKDLMQSVDLSYARYYYLKKQSIILDKSNYKILFCGERPFSKKFNITRKEILEDFPYRKRENNERAI